MSQVSDVKTSVFSSEISATLGFKLLCSNLLQAKQEMNLHVSVRQTKQCALETVLQLSMFLPLSLCVRAGVSEHAAGCQLFRRTGF